MNAMDSLTRKLDELAKTAKIVKLSQDEVREAVLLLSTKDFKRRFLIGNAILRQGLRVVPELVSAMEMDKPEIRRTVVYVMGKLFEQLRAANQPAPPELMDSLHRGLLDSDPKVRCNSAIALGDLRARESVGSLIDALSRETSPWVRPSMILALGSMGGSEVVAYLSSYQPAGNSERAALDKVLDRATGKRPDRPFVRNRAVPMSVELWTVEGLEDVVAEGVSKELSLAVGQATPGRVHTSTTDAYGLFALRTFSELLIPLAERRLSPPHKVDQAIATVAEMLRQENILERIQSLHEGEQETMQYRLEIRGREIQHSDRRTIIRGIVDLIGAACPAFVNSTSNYNVEIRLLLEGNSATLLLKPFTIPDDRFSYRVKDIPAAINPVVAAGIVRLAPTPSSHVRVLDPFCGSGTVLVERAFARGYEALVGIDISRTAIEAAKQNAGAAGLADMVLINDDMRNIPPGEPFDEIITNMPFGIRTGSHGANVRLYQQFFELIPRILAKHGLVILYTQEVRLTTSLFRGSKHLKLSRVHKIASGGLRPAVFVGTRR